MSGRSAAARAVINLLGRDPIKLRRCTMQKITLTLLTALLLVTIVTACSSPLTTREQGGLIGAGLGAGTGAIIGSTVGHAAAGALIGGPAGLIAGALIGDHLMGQEHREEDQQRQIERNQMELERLRQENERLQR